MPYVLADTGVWYGLCDPKDPFHGEATALDVLLQMHRIVLPWPVVYETLRTRFVRNEAALRRFGGFLRSRRVEYLDDSLYFRSALDLVFESSLNAARPLSMVDCALRLMLGDVNVRVDYLLTFKLPSRSPLACQAPPCGLVEVDCGGLRGAG